MREDIIYSLNTTDLQTVADDVIGRELTKGEMEKLKLNVSKRIDWYDIIEMAIRDELGVEKGRK